MSDPLEALRRQMEQLVDRLAEAERGAAPSSDPTDPAESGAGLHAEVALLSRKVDQAGDLLAQLTDVLETQAERLEALERRAEPTPGSQRSGGAGLGEAGEAATVERYRKRLAELEGKLGELMQDDSFRRQVAELAGLSHEGPWAAPLAAASEVARGEPPGGAPSSAAHSTQRTGSERGSEGDEIGEIRAAVATLGSRLDQGLGSLRVAIERLWSERGSVERGDREVALLRAELEAKEERIRELEDRLILFVDAPTEAARGPGAPALPGTDEPSGLGGGGREEEAEALAMAPLASEPAEVSAGGGLALATESPRVAPVQELEAPPGRRASRRSRGARSRLDGLERIVDRELRVQQAGVASTGAAEGVRPRKSRPTVMVVDDATDARTLLSMYLSRTGFQVVTAASAEDCLAKLRHHEVDAIVLDASLPGADGGHVCRVLRSEAAYASKRATPVIVYTGYPDEYTRKLADQWNADDYVIKGGDLLPLVTSLIRHTGNGHGGT